MRAYGAIDDQNAGAGLQRHQEGGKRTRDGMSETRASTEQQDDCVLYEIRVKGHLDDRWAGRFKGLILRREDNGDTLLTGLVIDQAALHRLLRQVRDLGLPLVSVVRVDPEQANGPDVTADTDHQRSDVETDT
jgi:hypothetical protein